MVGRYLMGVFGLLAFAICLLGGLVAGVSAETAIVRGLKAMVIFGLLGLLVGWLGQMVVEEYARRSLEPDEQQADSTTSEGTET